MLLRSVRFWFGSGNRGGFGSVPGTGTGTIGSADSEVDRAGRRGSHSIILFHVNTAFFQIVCDFSHVNIEKVQKKLMAVGNSRGRLGLPLVFFRAIV